MDPTRFHVNLPGTLASKVGECRSNLRVINKVTTCRWQNYITQYENSVMGDKRIMIVSCFPYFPTIDNEVPNPPALLPGGVHVERCSFPKNVCLQRSEIWGSQGQQQKGHGTSNKGRVYIHNSDFPT